MRYFAFLLLFITLSVNSYAFDPKQARQSHKVIVECKDIAWSDVQTLVEPYLSDDLNAALVMQGQSANYKVSLAAEQVISEPVPDIIKTLLESIIAADC
ncbi:hypothetical protein J8L84_15010 [Alteromonas sp. MMG017]|uniref:hypothetical protein n=1 Tax=Alteromonas sp. MMG017 TaxID=2822692 RepID=UPI001B39ECA2|nr:hypothetical protein [Alteromonas sp. MMG017]MBQ4830585.1 hypothetical protein [Alteromonas sp. MMG017]